MSFRRNKIYKIGKLKPIHLQTHCENICDGGCAISLSIGSIVTKSSTFNCYKELEDRIITGSNSFEPYLKNNELLQMILTTSIQTDREQLIIFQLDSGAQVSVISFSVFEKYFPHEKLVHPDSAVRLISADGRAIKVRGTVLLNLKVGIVSSEILFYIIFSGTSALIGLSDLITLKLKIDCGQLSAKEPYKRINEINIRMVTETALEVPEPQIVLWTVSKTYDVTAGKVTSLCLLPVGKFPSLEFYGNCIVFDCDCPRQYEHVKNLNNFEPCVSCKVNKPSLSSVVSPNRRIHFLYKSPISTQLSHSKDFFWSIFCPTPDLIHKCMYQNFGVKALAVQEPGWIMEGDSLEYDSGHVHLDREELMIENEVEPIGPDCNYKTFDEFMCSNVCDICKLCELTFCDLENPRCLTVIGLKKKIDPMSLTNVELIESTPSGSASFSNLSLIIASVGKTDQKSVQGKRKLVIKCFPHVEPLLDSVPDLTQMEVYNVDNVFHFFIYGSFCTALGMLNHFHDIQIICKKNSITSLGIINFEELKMSRFRIKELFSLEASFSSVFKLYLMSLQLFCSQNTDRDIESELSIGKICADKGFVAEIGEESSSPADQLNILSENPHVISSLRAMAMEVHNCEDSQNSVWSMTSNDIGSFRESFYPFRKYVFKFPIDKTVDLPNRGNKIIYASKSVEPIAYKLICKLLEMGIVERGHTRLVAPTFFVPKPRPELTLSKWLSMGNTVDTYVAGIEDMSKAPTVRVVHDFFMANSAMKINPILQQSPLMQLKTLCYSTKYISIVDITGSFHSYSIDEESKQMSGFHSGLSMGRLRYTVVAMGLSVSKTYQDAAILHALSGIHDLQLFSDNIMICSESEALHLSAVIMVFKRLQAFGLKVKPSKSSLFITDKVKVYGALVDLKTGKLSVEQKKIDAILNKPTPTTRKAMKSFLGMINFFSQLIKLVPECIAVLHQSTRGSTFSLNEEQLEAYETLIAALQDSKAVYSYRPDYSKIIYASCDTSDYHTAWSVWNYCANNHPRLCDFGMKTWGDSFKNKIPQIKELHGIVVCISDLKTKYAHGKGVVLFTDNLPLVLSSSLGESSAIMARFRIYIQHQPWLTLTFAPGTDSIMALSDYYSRNESSDKSVNKFYQCDFAKCTTVSNKICREGHFQAPQFMFLIESLLNLTEMELDSITNQSVKIDSDKKVRFDLNDNAEDSFSQTLSQRLNLNPEEVDALPSDVVKPVHRIMTRSCNKSTSRETAGSDNCHSNKSLKDEESLNLQSSFCGDSSEIELNEIHPFDPNFQNLGDINTLYQFLQPAYSQFSETSNKSVNCSNPLESTYDSFISSSKYLDTEKLFVALQQDPYWSKILEILRKQETYALNDKIFFIFKTLLMCKEKIKGIVLYKICLPELLSFSFVYQAHRFYNCIKSNKLFNQISLRFEIRGLMRIINMVVDECVNCTKNARLPCGATRQVLPKHPILLRAKNQCWNVDVLFVHNDKRTPWNKILVAVDLFSHFIICSPIIGTLDSEQFLSFVQDKIIAIFGPPQFISSDNEACICSKLVTDVCLTLGIVKIQSTPYQPRSNLSELMNQLLLEAMRNVIVRQLCTIEKVTALLSPIVFLVNSLVFKNERFMSPYLIMFGQLPRNDIYTFFQHGGDLFKSKHHYLRTILELQSIITKIRIGIINSRDYPKNSPRVQKHFDRIVPGVIVLIKNPSIVNKGKNHKLLPRFNTEFMVVRKTSSSVFLTPCIDVLLEDFQSGKKTLNDICPTDLFQVDITNLKYKRSLTLLTSNRSNLDYMKFIQGHSVPEPLYVFGSKFEGEISNFTSLLQKGVVNEDGGPVQRIEKISVSKLSTIICSEQVLRPNLKSSRHADIIEISNLFRSMQGNMPADKKVKTIVKTVSFDETVLVHPLVMPNFIYNCKKSRVEKLLDVPEYPVIRKLHSRHGGEFCHCNLCRVQKDQCQEEKCDKCF